MKWLSISSLGNFREVKLRDCTGTSGMAYHLRGHFSEDSKTSMVFHAFQFTCFFLALQTPTGVLLPPVGAVQVMQVKFSACIYSLLVFSDTK